MSDEEEEVVEELSVFARMHREQMRYLEWNLKSEYLKSLVVVEPVADNVLKLKRK